MTLLHQKTHGIKLPEKINTVIKTHGVKLTKVTSNSRGARKVFKKRQRVRKISMNWSVVGYIPPDLAEAGHSL